MDGLMIEIQTTAQMLGVDDFKWPYQHDGRFQWLQGYVESSK